MPVDWNKKSILGVFSFSPRRHWSLLGSLSFLFIFMSLPEERRSIHKETDAGISHTAMIERNITIEYSIQYSIDFPNFFYPFSCIWQDWQEKTLFLHIDFVLHFTSCWCQLTVKQKSPQVAAPSLIYGSTSMNLTTITIVAFEQALYLALNIQKQMSVTLTSFHGVQNSH